MSILPSSRMPRAGERGFTLAELLVTIGLLALLATLLAGGIGTLRFARAGGATRPENEADVIAAQTILRARIERMRGVVRLDSSEPRVDAQGNDLSFSFFAPGLPRFGPDALQRFRLLLSASGDLMLYSASSLETRIDMRDPSLVYWRPTRLIGGVRSIRIGYYGDDPSGSGQRWQTRWVDRNEPPVLVRVELAFAEGDDRYWPTLVIRPLVNVNTACRIDRYTQRCAVSE